MLTYILDANLLAPRLLVICWVVALTAILAVLIRRPGRWWISVGIGACCAVIITVVCLFVVNVWPRPFGEPVSTQNWLWIGGGFIGMAIGVVGLIRTPWWRKIAASVAILASFATAVVAVNASYGQYPSIRSVLGLTTYATFTETAPVVSGQNGSLWKSWSRPAGLPAHGKLYTADIPGTVSGFAARPASIYLPPAALTAHPPALPVVIALAGQPGSPSSMFTAGHLADILDAYAAQNNGLAPIVVSPDQLGTPLANPMCVDSPLGNSQTYLTKDVPSWIQAHLGVSANHRDWSILGFSQGGTCAIQLGAGFPALFGSLADLSGEPAPTLNDEQSTVKLGFHGSQAAYDAAKPLNILAAHHYTDNYAIFTVGGADSHYGPTQEKLFQAAKAAGMQATFHAVRGTSHDWMAATDGIKLAIALLYPWWGLSQKPLAQG
ncbi:MAG: alpha/beta hydrolase [Microbacteriaceae bacterium]